MSSAVTKKGAIIAVEGVEGAGKSTQVLLLSEALRKLGLIVHTPREPGGTPLGEEIRRILKSGNYNTCPESELLLFEASRAQLMNSLKIPLDAGEIVIMDRFTWSTVAYQGAGRGLDIGKIKTFNEFATSGVEPDLVVVLDLCIADSRKRLGTRGEATDNFEALPDPFFERVGSSFISQSLACPYSSVIDANQTPEAIHEHILEASLCMLEHKSLVNRGPA